MILCFLCRFAVAVTAQSSARSHDVNADEDSHSVENDGGQASDRGDGVAGT